MRLIFALGNPGREYNFTRHNLGFLALDFYLKKLGESWEPHEKFHSIYKKLGPTLLVKPQTFYNNVGLSLIEWKNFYKLTPENILIVCDDFNLPFATLRYRSHGSAGGNNGLKSIITSLGSDQIPRLRLGTGNEPERKKLGDMDFVLGKFTEEEKTQLPNFLNQIYKTLDEF